jgi:hypothetical protein
MPDILMCLGTNCTKAGQCFRARCKPSEFRQAYFVTPPIVDGDCKYFTPLVSVTSPEPEAPSKVQQIINKRKGKKP